MPLVPVLWKHVGQVNTVDDGPGYGLQYRQQVTQLANGNILVAWESSTDAGVGSPAGRDIVGRIYDPIGNPIGGEILLNTVHSTSNEVRPNIAATADGGFAVTYGVEITETNRSVIVEIFSAAGRPVHGGYVEYDIITGNTPNFSDPAIAINGPTSGIVAYRIDRSEEMVGINEYLRDQIGVRFFNPQTGEVGEARAIFQFNQVIGELHLTAIALGNGNYVIGGDYVGQNGQKSVIFKVIDHTGASITNVMGPGSGGTATDLSLTALNNGGFTAAWTYQNDDNADTSQTIRYRVYDGAGVQQAQFGQTQETHPGDQNEPAIASCADGGLLLVWDDNETGAIMGQRRYGTGHAYSDEFVIYQGNAGENPQNPVVKGLADGRIVVTWTVEFGGDSDVHMAFFDARDTPNSSSGNDDLIVGTIGNDLIDGFGGADRMYGGRGSDDYIVKQTGDQVFEHAGEGTDRIFTHVSHALQTGQSVEELWAGDASSTAPLNLTGNDVANLIIGSAGANALDGRGGADALRGKEGNDTYVVDTAGDVVIEAANQGTDIVLTTVSYALGADQSVETLQLAASTGTQAFNLSGNNIGNVLVGNAGANVLNGGAGADLLQGGAGNDSYVVDSAGDVVKEAAGAGTDTVVAHVSYALGAGQHVENLQFSSGVGAAALNLTGNELGNTIFGNGGANALQGLGGADNIIGGGGRDLIAPGNDTAVDTIHFNAISDSTGGNRDQVLSADFNNEDKLVFAVKNIAFLGTVTVGALNNGANFNIEIGNAVNGLLNAGGAIEAVLFDPSSGGLNQAGHSYLVVDANNDGSYTAGSDYLVELVNFIGTLDGTDFI